MNNVLILSKGMAMNYHALQNFLNKTPIEKKFSRTQRRSYTKGANRHIRKVLLLSKQDFKCLDCNEEFIINSNGQYSTATADHIIPWRYGGCVDHNIEFVCNPCNQKREKHRLFHIKRFFGSISD